MAEINDAGIGGETLRSIHGRRKDSRHRSSYGRPPGENTVEVTFLPEGKTVTFEHGKLPYKDHGKEQSLLDVALNNDISLDHACGGNCACTTCHIWVKEGAENLSDMEDDEADRLDMAADLQLNSRLGCQAVIKAGQSRSRDPSVEPELRIRGTLEPAIGT